MLLSRQEIKDVLNPNVLFGIQRNVCLYARVAVEELLAYTEKLETREQKLIEKLEERRKANQEEYDETLYNAHIEETNELKGKLLEDNYILKILKGEKE